LRFAASWLRILSILAFVTSCVPPVSRADHAIELAIAKAFACTIFEAQGT